MRIDRLKEPLAITMWDSSWLRRRYAGGGFESFDQALDELVERGYNAVRIDAFPHMIANAKDGTNDEKFLDPAGFGFHWYGFAQWGSPWTVYIHPRRDIVEFLKKCESRNIHVLLSTWLKPTAVPRNEWVNGVEDHVRIWDETLKFLSDQDCLKPVLGVDIQNEVPWGAAYPWLGRQLKERQAEVGTWNSQLTEFASGYYSQVLRELRMRWPEIPFAVSYDKLFYTDGWNANVPECEFLDVHIWAEFANCQFLEGTRYVEAIANFGEKLLVRDKGLGAYMTGKRIAPPDIDFERINDEIHESWYKNRAKCEEWMEETIADVAEKGKQYGIPVGCTEGWGSVMWVQHPMLSWDMIKEAGLIAARLGSKYGFTFNCQSNFCEPQFTGLWRDVEYHRKVTDIIRGKQ